MASIPNDDRISPEAFEQLRAEGSLSDQERVELIRGTLVEKPSRSQAQSDCIRRLHATVSPFFDEQAIAGMGHLLRLADSEIEPDYLVLAQRRDGYASGPAQGADVLLVVETVDDPAASDHDVMLGLYEENGIQEVWIADVLNKELHVYRQPRRSQGYQFQRVFRPGQQVDLVAVAKASIAVNDLF